MNKKTLRTLFCKFLNLFCHGSSKPFELMIFQLSYPTLKVNSKCGLWKCRIRVSIRNKLNWKNSISVSKMSIFRSAEERKFCHRQFQMNRCLRFGPNEESSNSHEISFRERYRAQIVAIEPDVVDGPSEHGFLIRVAKFKVRIFLSRFVGTRVANFDWKQVFFVML